MVLEFHKYIQILKLRFTKGLHKPKFLSEKQKNKSRILNEVNNIGIDEVLNKKNVILVFHDSSFRDPPKKIVKKIRKEIIQNMQELLEEDGIGYLCIPRNIPIKGKYSGFERRPQNYVILSLHSIYKDKHIEIYELKNNSTYIDSTYNIGEN